MKVNGRILNGCHKRNYIDNKFSHLLHVRKSNFSLQEDKYMIAITCINFCLTMATT